MASSTIIATEAMKRNFLPGLREALYADSVLLDMTRPPHLRHRAPWLDSGWRFHLVKATCDECHTWSTGDHVHHKHWCLYWKPWWPDEEW